VPISHAPMPSLCYSAQASGSRLLEPSSLRPIAGDPALAFDGDNDRFQSMRPCAAGFGRHLLDSIELGHVALLLAMLLERHALCCSC
jgi:hypothetical protein